MSFWLYTTVTMCSRTIEESCRDFGNATTNLCSLKHQNTESQGTLDQFRPLNFPPNSHFSVVTNDDYNNSSRTTSRQTSIVSGVHTSSITNSFEDTIDEFDKDDFDLLSFCDSPSIGYNIKSEDEACSKKEVDTSDTGESDLSDKSIKSEDEACSKKEVDTSDTGESDLFDKNIKSEDESCSKKEVDTYDLFDPEIKKVQTSKAFYNLRYQKLYSSVESSGEFKKCILNGITRELKDKNTKKAKRSFVSRKKNKIRGNLNVRKPQKLHNIQRRCSSSHILPKDKQEKLRKQICFFENELEVLKKIKKNINTKISFEDKVQSFNSEDTICELRHAIKRVKEKKRLVNNICIIAIDDYNYVTASSLMNVVLNESLLYNHTKTMSLNTEVIRITLIEINEKSLNKKENLERYCGCLFAQILLDDNTTWVLDTEGEKIFTETTPFFPISSLDYSYDFEVGILISFSGNNEKFMVNVSADFKIRLALWKLINIFKSM